MRANNSIKKLREAIDYGLITVSEAIGTRVNVGFMSLIVSGYEETPGDGAPNIWLLESDNGERYAFIPYNGIEKM